MDLGTDLRIARERAGFSLSELAARTRIPVKSLRAIEQNDYAQVPPGIFVRSFIRTYAREVGLDPMAAVEEYRAMTAPADDTPQDPLADILDDDSATSRPDVSESRPGWGYALMVAALLIAVISVNRAATSDQSDQAAQRDQPEPVAAAPAPAVVDKPSPPPIPVATAGTGVQIEMRADALCWVRATVDGQVAFARLLQPGETQSLSAERDIVLRVGDPAAFSYSINGRAGEPLGVADTPVTVRFGADGPSRVS
jgi:cytoskeletal protein RodZ